MKSYNVVKNPFGKYRVYEANKSGKFKLKKLYTTKKSAANYMKKSSGGKYHAFFFVAKKRR